VTQQQSIIIGKLTTSPQEMLESVLALIQQDENVRLKIVNEIQSVRLQRLSTEMEAKAASNGSVSIEEGAAEESGLVTADTLE